MILTKCNLIYISNLAKKYQQIYLFGRKKYGLQSIYIEKKCLFCNDLHILKTSYRYEISDKRK